MELLKARNLFVMLIGPSGAGKSTAIERIKHFFNEDFVVHSSDAIRGELWGDENDQRDPAKVFEVMNKGTLSDLKFHSESVVDGDNSLSVIYDATNLNRKRRKALLNQLPKDTCKIAVVVAAPPEVCIERASQRERKVPAEVIMRQIKSFQMPLESEGWDEIRVINTAEDISEVIAYSREIQTRAMNMSQDNPHHNNTVGEHNDAVGRNCAKAILEKFKEGYFSNKNETEKNVEALQCSTMGILHDAGKIYTKTIDENGVGHFFGHANVSSYLCFCLLPNHINGLKGVVKETYDKFAAIEFHMNHYGFKSKAEEYKFYNKWLSKEAIKYLEILKAADMMDSQ